MTRPSTVVVMAGLILMSGLGTRGAYAQPLGTFRWQLQPYCNVVTVSVTQNGAVYTLDGYDDQCAAATRAPLVGLGTPNPDGTVGLGFHIVTSPAGSPVSVSAAVNLATISGSWRDSAGHSGTFAYNAATGGSPRPAGGAATFPGGLSSGGARVTNVGAPTAPTDAATKAYVDAGDAALAAADTALAAQLPPTSQFTFQADGGFAARGAEDTGTLPLPSDYAGPRMMWVPARSAFRAGLADGDDSDEARIGYFSTALGYQANAVGTASFAAGDSTWASGTNAVALGSFSLASGSNSVSIGRDAQATGPESLAVGRLTRATGDNATAMGVNARAAGAYSIALGFGTVANGVQSVVFGNYAGTTVGATGSFVYGDASDTTGVNLVSSFPNEFLVRAAGGTTFFSNSTRTTGVRLAPGAGAWTNLSDAARKQTFRDLDGETVLGKLRAMPIQEWSYISQGDGTRHVGPTAQDFHAAFGLGEDPLGISTIDADGISLRAIQALEARTRQLQEENGLLRQRLEALEKLTTAPEWR